MKKSLVTSIMTVAAATALYAAPAAAQTQYGFDFRGANSPETGQPGNVREFSSKDGSFTITNGTITVKVQAWSMTSPTATPEQAWLGQYGAGLGVNSEMYLENGVWKTRDNSHTIDNVNRYDFVSLTFSTAVQLRWGMLTPFSGTGLGPDNDVSVAFTTDKNQGSILQPALLADLQKHTTELRGGGSDVNYWTNLNPGMNTGNIWTIGADRLTAMNSDMNDGFKLTAITVQIPTPEPATWAMMIGGFGVVGGSMRRRRSTNAKLAHA